MIRLALWSLVVGLTVGAPVGPTGALCSALALRGKLRSALAGGAGSALAMAIWGATAGLGQSWIGARMSSGRIPVLTGLLIAGYGIALWIRGPATKDAPSDAPWAVTTLCLSMVMLNPGGLVAVALLTADAVSRAAIPPWRAGLLVGVGVGLGTFIAFAAVMPLMARLGGAVGERVRRGIVRGLSVGLILFGTLLALRSLRA